MFRHNKPKQKPLRVGIYAGTFDPVHAGHIAFALQAIEQASLDEVVFMPERMPRYKTGVEHFGHRVAMLRHAVKPHPKLSVAELVERHFSVAKTMPQLRSTFRGAELVLLVGSDVAVTIPHWDNAHELNESTELVVGLRADMREDELFRIVNSWRVKPKELTAVTSHVPHVSSRKVREAIQANSYTPGLLVSVVRYAKSNWLYIAFPKA